MSYPWQFFFYVNNTISIIEIKGNLESKCSFVLLLLGSWAILSLITLRNQYLRGHNHNYHLCISLNRLHFHSTHSWLWVRPVQTSMVPICIWTDFEETAYGEINCLPMFVCNVHTEHSKGRELEGLSVYECILCERNSLSTIFTMPVLFPDMHFFHTECNTIVKMKLLPPFSTL